MKLYFLASLLFLCSFSKCQENKYVEDFFVGETVYNKKETNVIKIISLLRNYNSFILTDSKYKGDFWSPKANKYEIPDYFLKSELAEYLKFDIKTGDTEGIVNYPLSIEGIKFAAIIIDRGEERKCSFRSKGEFDVNTFARTYFNGGGHYNAAGGATYDSLEKAVDDFKTAMMEHKKELSTYTF